MRHHFSVIKELVRDGNAGEAEKYIDSLGEKLEGTEQRTYTANPIVNAVLSRLLEKAERCGAEVQAAVNIPKDLPFDAADVCAVLSNLVENAVNACCLAEAGERKLRIAADGRFPVYIKVNGGIRRAMTDEIVMIESFNHRREVKLSDGQVIETPTTLSEFYEILKPYREFSSPHRAYIVNMNYITGVQGSELYVGREAIPIAKSAYRKFKENYIRFCFEK